MVQELPAPSTVTVPVLPGAPTAPPMMLSPNGSGSLAITNGGSVDPDKRVILEDDRLVGFFPQGDDSHSSTADPREALGKFV